MTQKQNERREERHRRARELAERYVADKPEYTRPDAARSRNLRDLTSYGGSFSRGRSVFHSIHIYYSGLTLPRR